jgi:hypothetical protein
MVFILSCFVFSVVCVGTLLRFLVYFSKFGDYGCKSDENGCQKYASHVARICRTDTYLFMTLVTFLFRTDRQAGRDVTIQGVFIPKGMSIDIPIYAVHHDPEYWPEPDRFDPERQVNLLGLRCKFEGFPF